MRSAGMYCEWERKRVNGLKSTTTRLQNASNYDTRNAIRDILSTRMRIALKYYDLFVLFVSYRYDYFKVSFTYQETSETRTIQMLLDFALYSQQC